nr:Ldh family oxidoreductase [Rhizobium leguminosarum]
MSNSVTTLSNRGLPIDFATSSMSNGDLRIAAREGHSIPMGTGIDASGALSDSPSDILNGGALLPFGGHKGAAVSPMVEVLASALTGGQFSAQVDFSGHPGAETSKNGPDRDRDRSGTGQQRCILLARRQADRRHPPSRTAPASF